MNKNEIIERIMKHLPDTGSISKVDAETDAGVVHINWRNGIYALSTEKKVLQWTGLDSWVETDKSLLMQQVIFKD